MTIWAAKAAFEEDLKGSLEKEKLADLVITHRYLMSIPEEKLFALPLETTYSGGRLVFSS
jgi:predicted amidohydrolase YtcJ